MKTDFYTKVVLTVIAAALVWLVAKPLLTGKEAIAQAPTGAKVMYMEIVNWPTVQTGMGFQKAIPITVVGTVNTTGK